MSQSKLIFSADDSGVVREIDDAVIDLVNMGILNSTEVLPNYFNPARTIHHSLFNAKRILSETESSGNPLELGIHLTITSGKPVTHGAGLESILDTRGNFISFGKLPSSADDTHLYQELKTQAQLLLDDTHLRSKITHISNHHDALWFYPNYTRQLEKLANYLKLPVRSPIVKPHLRSKIYYVWKNKFKFKASERMSKPDRKIIENAFWLRMDGKFPGSNLSYRSTNFLDSSIYHLMSQLFITGGSDFDKYLRLMNRDLMNMIASASAEKATEFMFHIYKGNLGQLNGDGDLPYYSGINKGYFDGRILEYNVLKTGAEHIKGEILENGCLLAGWSDLDNFELIAD